MPTKTKFILLADDDPEDLELFEELMLSVEPGLIIKTTTGGKALMQFLSDCHDERLPDLIILDYNMPQMKGAELLRELNAHKRYTAIPLYVLSTSDSPAHARECIDAGARAYYIKPGNLEDMKAMITNIVTSF